ncbi:MAG: flippase-like domain-containing protein [Deltaproteobacteria bacterium]|nr:flippase-like domain-containing protein [Deltaproteobacteria bacterium]MDQ3296723.1 flippase-like domain-containing protein [Myxococcota bacterium]
MTTPSPPPPADARPASHAAAQKPAAADAGNGRNSNWGAIFNLVMMVVGGIALYFLLQHLDWDEIRSMLVGAGGWFALVLGLELVALCMDAAALHAFMRPEARMISYWRVLGAQASGRALNVLMPGGALGEPTKLMLLSTHAPRSRALSSLVLLSLTMAYISVTVMVIGIPITMLLLDVPDPVKVSVGIGLAIILPAMIALTVVVRRGAVSTVVGLMQRLRIVKPERAKQWRAKLVDVDRHIRELQTHRSQGTWKGILWVLGSKLVSWTSSMTLIAAVGVDLSPSVVIGALSVGMLIGWISQIVPMGLGIQDGGNYALFGILGATGPQGLLVAMLQRARSVTVAILGLCAMATLTIVNRLAARRIHQKLVTMREANDNSTTDPAIAVAPDTAADVLSPTAEPARSPAGT